MLMRCLLRNFHVAVCFGNPRVSRMHIRTVGAAEHRSCTMRARRGLFAQRHIEIKCWPAMREWVGIPMKWAPDDLANGSKTMWIGQSRGIGIGAPRCQFGYAIPTTRM